MLQFLPSRASISARTVLALTLTVSSIPANAQLRLPDVNIGLPSRLPDLSGDSLRRDGLLGQPRRLLAHTRIGELPRLRQIEQLIRRHPAVIDIDPSGAPIVRRELIATSPSAAALAAARAAGLRVLREQHLEGLDQTVIALAVPDGLDMALVLANLRALDPDGGYDFNHVYQGGGAAQEPRAPVARQTSGNAPASGLRIGLRIGLIDGGVDSAHPVFAATRVQRWGCNGAVHPNAHGNSVAALMAGSSAHFSGVLPRADLYAADIYCASPSGGAADAIAGALNWMAVHQVPVVNLSIVGPHNRTLERAVAALLRRGHLLVAAVGNDGPAAPPLYPASYPGVIGVSAVDKRGRVLPEAARGAQVKFAAPGDDMVSAALGTPPYRRVRGTSFAAPIVAALLAEHLAAPDPAAASAAVANLAGTAGSSTPNFETGHGVVGTAYRTDPSELRRVD